MPFKIVNTEKKDVVETCVWKKYLKNNKVLQFEEETGYRWGEVTVEDDPREHGWEPGTPLRANDFNSQDHSLADGCWSNRIGVENLSKKEQALLADAEMFPEEAGWECEDCEITFHGPVDITEE